MGEWSILGSKKSFQGILQYEDGLICLKTTESFENQEVIKSYNTIVGFLENGKKITLTECINKSTVTHYPWYDNN